MNVSEITDSTIFEKSSNIMVQRDFSIIPYETVPNALRDPSYELPSEEEPSIIVSKMGKLYSLNHVGACAFDLLDGHKSVEDIIVEMKELFSSNEGIEEDVLAFMNQLFSAGLINQMDD